MKAQEERCVKDPNAQRTGQTTDTVSRLARSTSVLRVLAPLPWLTSQL